MSRSHVAATFLAAAAACGLWSLHAGKDLNWDLLNYHFYLPFELLHGRLQQDFFAASGQSYLNPVGYVPFYAMVAAGWHSVVVSLVLAGFHSFNIALLYLIGWRIFEHQPHAERITFSVLAAAFGAATPVFWPTVGTSFLDPSLTVPILAALCLLLDGRGATRVAAAGALLGVATALKYSNAIFILAALPLVLTIGERFAGRARDAVAYATGVALGLAVFAGPWVVMLAREFGNPVFPMLNGWFHSPDAPAVNGFSVRFGPQNLMDALAFPFRMAGLDRSLYVETFAPDIRIAALVVGMAALLPYTARIADDPRALRPADWRLFAFLALSGVLWLATSANGRYGLAVLLIAGPCLARIVERVLPLAAARVVLVVLLTVQLAMGLVATPTRWFLAEPWSRTWFGFRVPPRAAAEPALYLTLEVLPMAAVIPFLDPASSFVNIRGQHSLAADAPRLRSLLERYRGRVRALGRGIAPVDGRLPEAQVQAYDATLQRFGYRIDARDCFAIAWRAETDDPLSRAANRLASPPTAPEPLSLGSCALLAAAPDPARAARERRISALFDRIERSCPGLFRGHTAVTDPLAEGWSRNYTELDARLEARGERIFLNRYRAGTAVELGRVEDWESSRLPAACLSSP